jgi:hypothetical protein
LPRERPPTLTRIKAGAANRHSLKARIIEGLDMKRALTILAAGLLAASASLAQGPGGGPGKGPGWSFNADNTRGWPMMSMKSYEECLAYLGEHHKRMEARAQERGRPGPAMPAHSMCERMKQAGRFG